MDHLQLAAEPAGHLLASVAPLLLTIKEACHVLRISKATFYREVTAGRIRTVPVAGGRYRRVHIRELKEYAERACREADDGR